MSRFDAPLDPFEMDDFSVPSFQAPPTRPRSKRAPRPQTPSVPIVLPQPAQSARRPTSSTNARPRPNSQNARPNSRPQTNSNGAKNPSSTKRKPKTPLRSVHYEIAGVLLIALGGLLGYSALQVQADGILPRYGLATLRALSGAGAVALPFGIAYLGFVLLIKRERANLRAFWRGALVAFLVFLTFKALQVPRGALEWNGDSIREHGGYIGAALGWILRRILGEVGALVALVALSLVALLLWTEDTLGHLLERGREMLSGSMKSAKQKASAKIKEKREQKSAREDEDSRDDWDDDAAFVDEAEEENPFVDEESQGAQRVLPLRVRRDVRAEASRRSPFLPIDDLLNEAEIPMPPARVDEKLKAKTVEPEPTLDLDSPLDDPKFVAPRIEIVGAAPPLSVVDAEPLDLKAVVANQNVDEELTPIEALEKQAEESAQGEVKIRAPKPELPRRRFGDGPLMPEYFDDAVRALDPPVPPDTSGAEEEIAKGVAGVQETLAAFKIDARVTDVKRGPVITRYEVQPGAGVRVASISNLDKDLARSLSALAVRIEAPVPGKNVVGIEIPNKKVHLVRMRDVLEQPDFLAHQSKLAFVLGKDIAGQPKWGDLTKMPHLLIAGSTNSGKSVCLNSVIASILVRARPDEVRFSLIDPKRVELTLYKGIRHLMHDVVVEPKQAVIALRRAIEEMDRRYKLFAARGVRNIVSFNAKLQENEKPLPYIVIVIDELADLMMTAAAEFEKLICRLAQLARATGIHLIVATQRPSVNVITGVIKANIPARIAFAVASQVDSRTILDSVGAERLIGSGDMLYDSNNGGKSTRIQGAFLSEDEVNRIVEVVKVAYQYEDDEMDALPEFDLFQADEDTEFESESMADEKRDSLYDEILEFVQRHNEMSASNIQRKFGIGYPRAGRIVDQLERHGILGPADGPKARKVIARPSED